MGYTAPRIAIYDTTAQTISVTGTAQIITFNTLDVATKFTQTSSSRFTVIEPGRYLIIGRAQINLTTGTNKFLNIWIRKNGSDVVISNSRWGLTTTSSDLSVPILCYVDCAAGDYLELWMAGDSTGLQITNVASGGGAPVTDSINIVITKTG